jgi:ParB family chromosome partitioning protein
LADLLGLTVQIKLANKGRGQLTVQFASLDEFDGLLSRLRPDDADEAVA